MIRFVDDHRETYGVEPIGAVIAMAPSWYPQPLAPGASRRCHRLASRGGAAHAADELLRAGRGHRSRTAVPATEPDTRPDLVQRPFVAERPNQRSVADFTSVLIWRGVAYVVFVIDVFSRRIVRWCVASHMRRDLALEQGLYDRGTDDGLIHHGDRRSQCFVDCVHRASRRRTPGSLRGESRRQLRQRPCRDDPWPLQDPRDPPQRRVAQRRGGGICHAQLGRVVQQRSPDGTPRLLCLRRVRGAVCSTSSSRTGRRGAQPIEAPEYRIRVMIWR